MSWFAVRTLYVHGKEADGRIVYEERIQLFRASTADGAVDMAESESARYLQLNPTFERFGKLGIFALGPTVEDLDGAEVWSLLGASTVPPDEFYQKRYAEVEFQAEDV